MSDQPLRSRPVWIAVCVLLGLHAALLIASIPDYRVTIDAGYHVSLARWYGEHGTAFWDHINYGPGGRPNLQGPAMHMGVAAMGRLFGGSGDDYVLANAILAVLQWAAAMFTAVFFARRFGGDWGALLAAALLSGNALASGSFAIGIPSGWIFILTPWAIHFFLEGRLVLSTLATSLAIYAHLAGYATAPVGVLVAALIVRRWRHLIIVGAGTAILTSPYTIHLLGNLDWYRGERGHVALMMAPLIYIAAAPALIWVLRRPKERVFLLAWFAAPIAWVFQDYTRFLAQATLVMATMGGVWLARVSERFARPWRVAFAAVTVAVATLPSPVNHSSFVSEAAWAAGVHYPQFVDWNDSREVAGVIERAGLTNRLIAPYNPSQCIRFAVYAPMTFEKGHWVEVQPHQDPAEDLSAGAKAYILAMAPRDPVLLDLARRGWLTVHGGSARESVVTLGPRPAFSEAVPVAGRIFTEEAAWLAANARNNLQYLERPPLLEQRTRAARLQLAMIITAYALEPALPNEARGLRGAVRGFGSLSNFLGDDACIGFVSDARHGRMRRHMADLSKAARGLTADLTTLRPFGAALRALFDDYFTAA